MRSTLTHKQRLIVLLAGTLLLILIAYVFALRKTINRYSEYTALKQQNRKQQNYYAQVGELRLQLEKINRIIGNSNYAEIPLLNKMAHYAEGKKIVFKSLPAPRVTEDNGYRIYHQQLSLTGHFKDLLSFVYALENDKSIGMVRSVEFTKEKDRSSRKEVLIANVLLQNIQPVTNNNRSLDF